MSEQEHQWEPVPGWRGRYRCPACGAFGYKPAAVVADRETMIGRSTHIQPYKCTRCPNPAIAKDQLKGRVSKEWRCAAHRV